MHRPSFEETDMTAAIDVMLTSAQVVIFGFLRHLLSVGMMISRPAQDITSGQRGP